MKTSMIYTAAVNYVSEAGDKIKSHFESSTTANLLDQIEIAFQNIGKIKNRKVISRMIHSLNFGEAVEISVPAGDQTYDIVFTNFFNI